MMLIQIMFPTNLCWKMLLFTHVEDTKRALALIWGCVSGYLGIRRQTEETRITTLLLYTSSNQ